MYKMSKQEWDNPYHGKGPNGIEELWEKMRFINPNIKLNDFEEELKEWGICDLTIQTNIHLKWRLQMIKRYGGDGLSHLRLCLEQDKTGELDYRVLQNKKKWDRVRNKYDEYLLHR